MATPTTGFLNKLGLNYKDANGKTQSAEFESFIDFDHVYYDNKEYTIEAGKNPRPWTLRDFFNKVSTFFNKRMFMIYSKSDSSPALNIMEWYEVSGDVDSRMTEQ